MSSARYAALFQPIRIGPAAAPVERAPIRGLPPEPFALSLSKGEPRGILLPYAVIEPNTLRLDPSNRARRRLSGLPLDELEANGFVYRVWMRTSSFIRLRPSSCVRAPARDTDRS